MPSNNNNNRPQRHSLNSLPPRPAAGGLAPSSSTGQQRPHRASYTQQRQRPGRRLSRQSHNPLYDDDDHHDQDHHQDHYDMLQDVLRQSLQEQGRGEGEAAASWTDDDAIKHRERQARQANQNPSYAPETTTAPAMTSPPKATASASTAATALSSDVEDLIASHNTAMHRTAAPMDDDSALMRRDLEQEDGQLNLLKLAARRSRDLHIDEEPIRPAGRLHFEPPPPPQQPHQHHQQQQQSHNNSSHQNMNTTAITTGTGSSTNSSQNVPSPNNNDDNNDNSSKSPQLVAALHYHNTGEPSRQQSQSDESLRQTKERAMALAIAASAAEQPGAFSGRPNARYEQVESMRNQYHLLGGSSSNNNTTDHQVRRNNAPDDDVEAQPVSAVCRHSNDTLDLSTSQEEHNNHELEELERKERRRRKIFCMGVICVPVAILGVISLVLVLLLLTGGDDGGNDLDALSLQQQGPNSQSHNNITQTTAVVMMDPADVLVDVSEETLQAIREDPHSNLYLAYDWLIRDPHLATYPTWKAQQRFAMTALYLSLNGPGWTDWGGTHWMSYYFPECQWQVAMEGLQPCNSTGALQVFDLSRIQESTVVGSLPTLDVMALLPALQIINIENQKDLIHNLTAFFQLLPSMSGGNPTTSGNATDVSSSSSLLSSAFPSLQKLRLSECDIQGSIPSEFGALTSLQNLILDGNRLTGSIPETLGELPWLTTLQVQDNPDLDPTLPEELFCHGRTMDAEEEEELDRPPMLVLETDACPSVEECCSMSTNTASVRKYRNNP